jgi:hypothetical protein
MAYQFGPRVDLWIETDSKLTMIEEVKISLCDAETIEAIVKLGLRINSYLSFGNGLMLNT